MIFADREAHRAWLAEQAELPLGFRVGTARFAFTPIEAPKPAKMTLTLIALDQPTRNFAALFTKNALPGAPVIIGRKRLEEPALGAIIVNNKISNVCAPGGVETSEAICEAVAQNLGYKTTEILPCSTGVIGWTLPRQAIIQAVPQAVAALTGDTIMPAAEGIVTTDLYPKVRYAKVGSGRIVGIAKGAGMIEPNLATMLVYLLTDIEIPREELRAMLRRAVAQSFNTISIDSDTSTSDTVVLVSSGRAGPANHAEFEQALTLVCKQLSRDVVRNGEGVRHVIRINVSHAASREMAAGLGKTIVNAPLFKCAIAGNDPNVGRLVQAIGKFAGGSPIPVDLSKMRIRFGGIEIFSEGVFRLDPEKETQLVAHLKAAELYVSANPKDGIFSPPIDYPPHERFVEIEVDLGNGNQAITILGGDLTHEYVSENADYRS